MWSPYVLFPITITELLTISPTNHIWKLCNSTILRPYSPVFMVMATSTPIGLFYEPGAPPPPLPLLTAQTDLLGNSPRPSTLTNAEVLPRSGPPRVPSHSRRTQVTLSRPSRSTCDSTPSDSPPASDLSDSSGSDSSELSDSDSSTDSDVAKIPKPPGEAGRPGRGRYTLEEALDWNPKMYKKLKVRDNCVTGILFTLTHIIGARI